MPTKYKMLADSTIDERVKKGATVYHYDRYDYGLARDDTWATGIEHISCTLDPYGNDPFFTVPVPDLEKIS